VTADDPLTPDSAEDLYENAPCGYLSTLPDGRIARVNQTFLTWTGYRRDQLVGLRRFVELLTPGGRIYHETHYAPLLQMQGTVRAIALDIVRADGSRMPVLVNSQLRADPAGTPIGVRTTVFDATDRRQYETELLAARRRAEQATSWVRAVEQVVADLAAVAGAAEVSEVVARAGTAVFGARRSAVWLADADAGVLRLVAGDADLTAAVWPADVTVEDGLVLTPIVAGERALGVLVLERSTEDPVDPDELSLLQTLGRQAGQAVERAQLYDEQRSVATTLQHSLLPRTLPDDPRLGLSACYRPAVEGLEVGGDWYDAFLLDADRVAVVVGDVVGRGLAAAAVMGQLRSAVRALAAVDSGPSQLLARLDRFVDGVPAAETATLAYAEVDLRDGRVRYACAGHPPPVLVDPAGRAVLLWDGRSAPLGAHFGGDRAEAEVILVPGSRLSLYTDGLVERRDEPLDACIDRLATLLGESAAQPLTGLADSVTDTALGTRRTGDDVCLLLVAFEQDPTFSRSVPADTSRVAVLRSDLTHWLQSNGVVGQDHDATLLACSEAVSNAIEHGYAGDRSGIVDVLATLSPGLLRVRVRDRGLWRAPGPPGHRGRGLELIRALMDHVSVDHTTGTVVTMRRRIAPEVLT
jgi:PAS domain S-box-containing protein